MSISSTQMITRVHYLLGQDVHANATKYVSKEMILDFLNEGIAVMCLMGKVYEQINNEVDVDTRIPYATIANTDTKVVDIVNVEDSSGRSLRKVDPYDKGKLFETTVADDIMYYYMFAENLYLLPPASNGTVNIYYTAAPVGDLVEPTATGSDFETPPFPDKFHTQVVNFATFRGKMVYGLDQEAMTFLKAFGEALGISIEELKTKLGVS